MCLVNPSALQIIGVHFYEVLATPGDAKSRASSFVNISLASFGYLASSALEEGVQAVLRSLQSKMALHANIKGTSIVESFHSFSHRHWRKFHYYSAASFRARILLAALEWNAGGDNDTLWLAKIRNLFYARRMNQDQIQ